LSLQDGSESAAREGRLSWHSEARCETRQRSGLYQLLDESGRNSPAEKLHGYNHSIYAAHERPANGELDILAIEEQGLAKRRIVTRARRAQDETCLGRGEEQAVRRPLVFITVALSALAVATTSSAQRAVHLNNALDISASFQSQLLSGQCGFPVTVTVSGALDETLIYNDVGLVVRQIENSPAATASFSSPYGSFSFPEAATSVFTYPGGATLGSTANFHSSGLLRFGLVPGFGTSNAGIDIVANAVVVDFTAEGIPIVDFTESTVVISDGNRNSDEEIFTAICAALGPA
jgi:hypothetical protein